MNDEGGAVNPQKPMDDRYARTMDAKAFDCIVPRLSSIVIY
jgi:hypothetical protein